MFSTSVNNFVGQFDSKSEEQIARNFVELVREQKLNGFLLHPKVAGVEADFLIKLGRDLKGDTLKNGQIVVVEYDGLKLSRKKDLGPKLQRYGRLNRSGLKTRWLFNTDKKKILSSIKKRQNKTPVTKRLLCSNCGESEKITVLSPKENPDPNIYDTISNCKECK